MKYLDLLIEFVGFDQRIRRMERKFFLVKISTSHDFIAVSMYANRFFLFFPSFCSFVILLLCVCSLCVCASAPFPVG